MQSGHKIAFSPSGKRGEAGEGKDILQVARDIGVGIETSCGGNGQCGKCQVSISEGSFSKFQIESSLAHVSDLTSAEKQHQKTGYLREGYRLACCTKVLGDVVVDVPAFSQAQKQMVRKSTSLANVEVQGNIDLYEVLLAEPNMHDQDGDGQLLKKALWFEHAFSDINIEFPVFRDLQAALKEGNRRLVVAIRDRSVVAVFPKNDNAPTELYGLAFDIGSTTIAGHLVSLKSAKVVASGGVMNPQIRFGEDLMSRVSYIIMNEGGLANMNGVLLEAINDLVDELIKEAGINKNWVLESVFVANPVMHHIFLKIDPSLLGVAPFVLATNEALYLDSNEIGLKFAKAAKSYILPCIAGHVGADAASVVLSTEIEKRSGWTLSVDIGTNAEIVLANKERIFACSSPTGPAFEGAQISSGQRAAIGAIERVKINRETLEPSFKIIGCDYWSDEPEFAEATADITVSGICGSGIIEVVAELYLSGIISQDGVFDASLAEQTERLVSQGRTYAYRLYKDTVDILVTQNDIRQIQLAKAALYAGAKLLFDKAKITQPDRILLAGAFGSHINVEQAMVLGLIPDCKLSEVVSVGNAAGDGAIKALLNIQAREHIEALVRRIYKVETATEADFQRYFIDAMAIPNKTDPFTELQKQVVLPQAKEVQTETRKRTRRRGRV